MLLPLSTSQKLAEFATRADLGFPELARLRAADAIVDCIGCILAGLAEPVAQVVSDVIHDSGNGVPMIGSGRKVSPADSALFHGTLAHAIDYDDTNHPAYAHPSAVLVPAMLAILQTRQPSGADFITTYIVGFQVFGKLGRVLNFAHYERGWHSTATFGTLAAAVVAGRLLGLDARQLTMAIGIAASSASGLRVNFGTMVKPLHAGSAARNGVLAALLAEQGMDASVESLDHRYGYFDVFNDGIAQDVESLADWTSPLEILTPNGLALKAFPACGAAHTAIEAALALRPHLDIGAIERIVVHVPDRALAPLIHAVPRTPLEAKFSMQFCVAAALCDGAVNLDTFSHERIDDPMIRDLLHRVSVVQDGSLPNPSEFPARVEVTTRDGGRHESMVPLAVGKPARWFTEAQLRDKFMDCATQALSEQDADAMFSAIRQLDRSPRAADTFSALGRVSVAHER